MQKKIFEKNENIGSKEKWMGINIININTRRDTSLEEGRTKIYDR